MWRSIREYFHNFGYRQVRVWYGSSPAVADQFETISKKLRFLKIIPNPYPFYDWIMGFHERWSNRAALRGPVLEGTNIILEAGVGTGYLLSQLVKKAKKATTISAVDLSPQMITAAKNYIRRKNLLSQVLTFVRGDCRRLPYPDGYVDLYVSSYLFDLLSEEEMDAALTEMERVLSPNGHAILVSMTTELDGLWAPVRLFYRVTNELYCLGYYRGRWNRIWKFLFAGYAPHCRPIALGRHLKAATALTVEYTKVSHVSLFPVRIYYVGKRDA